MKMYNNSVAPRICGDCTDLMMRGPITVRREIQRTDGISAACDLAENICPADGCGTADEASDSPLAIVSSPYQGFGDVFDCPAEALAHGTLFLNLVFPIQDANGVRGKGGCGV